MTGGYEDYALDPKIATRFAEVLLEGQRLLDKYHKEYHCAYCHLASEALHIKSNNPKDFCEICDVHNEMKSDQEEREKEK